MERFHVVSKAIYQLLLEELAVERKRDLAAGPVCDTSDHSITISESL